MKNLAPHHPAEVLEISPEALEIANCYLIKQSAQGVADELSISTELVTNILARREVKAYIDQVFFDTGFNNRFRMRDAMDAIIQKKFEELDEADVGSSKDILEILALSHKMTMETLDRQIQLEKLKSSNLRTQTNIQINEGGGSNYHTLIEKLVRSNA
jgi:hypothetical protein